MSAERRFWVGIGGGLALLVYSKLYDAWRLWPQISSFGTFGRVLAGDVLPLLVGPLVLAMLVLKTSPRELGWHLPRARTLLATSGLAWAAIAPLAIWLAFQPEFRAFYPSRAFPPAREHGVGLAFLWVLHHGPQLFALESCMRGFLFFPLLRRGGFPGAVATLLPLYVLLHLGKPPFELALAAWGGLVLMAAAARSRSFLPAFVAHWLVAVTIDLLCYAQLHGWL
jgi:Type II CAAX prenyl endopeptidase Rce1-like